MSYSKYDYLFKIVIMGYSSAGKQDFILRFIDDSSTANHLTTFGFDCRIKTINFENKLVKLQIWDFGREEFSQNITKTYYKGAHGLILMYNVTERNSFQSVRNWIEQIEDQGDKSVKKVLVGHICDEDKRVVTKEEGKKLAEEYNIGFFESSARNNINVSEVFNYLIKEILMEKDPEEIKKREKEKKEESSKKIMNILMKYISF